MTSTDLLTGAPASVHPRSAPARIWNVVRLHLVDRRTYIGIPWLIVGMAFVITVFIAQIIGFTVPPTLSRANDTAGRCCRRSGI